MKIHSFVRTTLALTVVVFAGCKPAPLDSGFVAAHEAAAEAACCRARAYASAAGGSGDVADAMNAAAEGCYASFGGIQGVADRLQSAVPSGYDSEYDYTSKLSDEDRAKIEGIQKRAQDCSMDANKAWDANIGL